MSRVAYMVMWIFENLYTLCCIEVLRPQLKGLFFGISRSAWALGLFVYLVYCLKTLRKTYNDESDLKVNAVDNMTVGEMLKNLNTIVKLRYDYNMNLGRTFSDLLICLNELRLPYYLLGIQMNDGVEGVFGILSATIFITCLY